MQSEGWIAVYRSLLSQDHDLHPFSTGETACQLAAWIDLISRAKWEDESDLERGQLKMKQRTLAHRWNWSRSKVKRFLERLEADGRISRDPQTGPKPTVVTICNYDDYQFSRPQSDHKATRGATTYSNDEKQKNRVRTRTRENGSSPSGPGAVPKSGKQCPDCGDELKERGERLYCSRCAQWKPVGVMP